MANVLVLGGGFGGLVAAKRLARMLPAEHRITLVSRGPRFVFYPALVRLAFGQCGPDDVSFDLRGALADRRVRFIEAEVARVDPRARRVTFAGGEVEGGMPYDFLLLALGRRLATERVPGFFEHAHHLLSVESALQFGDAARNLKEGHAVLGFCPGARLAVPAYEAALALSRLLEEKGLRGRTRITVVSPDPPGELMEGAEVRAPLRDALDAHDVAYWSDFPVTRVTAEHVYAAGGPGLRYDLLMLVPPFRGPGPVNWTEAVDDDGYVVVDGGMRVVGAERVYAAGDCVSLPGPKMGHMAVKQAEVAARNLAAEIEGRVPDSVYWHEETLVIDEGGPLSLYVHKDLPGGAEATVRQGRFWGWAKRAHERYWERVHS